MKKLTNLFTNLAHKYLPDAYIFALLLTLLVFILGIIFGGHSPLKMIEYWGDGFWNLMEFSMQMTMILICGYTLAQTQIIQSLIIKLAGLAKSNISATILVTLVSSTACAINWGFGLIVSALFAVEVARQVKKVNFALLLASSYSGFLVWHGGLSGSIPLKLTSPSSGVKEILGVNSIELSQTIFTPLNFTLLIGTILVITLVNYFFSKDDSKIGENFEFTYDKDKTKDANIKLIDSPASKLEHSKLLNLSIGGLGLIYISIKLAKGNGLNLNLVIFIFLTLAILFNKTPLNFLRSFSNSVKQSSGILIQFPFYAGIMGMMSMSGLALDFSQFFVSISTKSTFLVSTFISSGILNFFIPSGGGQWAIQAPIILPAAKVLGVDLAKASMAIAWGDAWTNMIQPFWAIPLLSITKLKLKDIMGYLVIIFVISGLFSASVFAIISL
jgi:short-chain fatty acids transporter